MNVKHSLSCGIFGENQTVCCTVFVKKGIILIFVNLKYPNMKTARKLFISAIIIITAIAVSAQDSAVVSLPAFTGISAVGKMRVELYHSDLNSALIKVVNTAPGNVITEVKDSCLSIRLKTDTDKSAVILVKVYYKELKELTVAANTLLVSPETILSPEMSFIARSGAKMELDLDITDLKAEVKQGAILVFTGKVKKQDVAVNTGATYSAYRLKAEDTYVTATTGSKAKVSASRIINADSNTKSYIGYIGTPVSVLVKTNLGGEIESFATESDVFEE